MFSQFPLLLFLGTKLRMMEMYAYSVIIIFDNVVQMNCKGKLSLYVFLVVKMYLTITHTEVSIIFYF